jgi:glycosyltransferase involved in cell wall biosynthesis
MISIVIPSKNEKFLRQTILDILDKATGDIEIFPVLDGYNIPDEEAVQDPRVHYILLEPKPYSQKRLAINSVVNFYSHGEYVMSVDAHCMFAKGFDEQLVKDHQPNWVQIPRRHRLDAENWALQPQGDDRPPIDYEYIMFNPLLKTDEGMHGFKWDERTLARQDIMIDDTLTFQGSCWFMTKKWFQERGFMDERYQGWGQEAEEISFETWKNGGRVVTNKNTWYAHLHKGKKYGRMYFLSKDENRKSYEYSYDLWINKNKDFFISLIERFMPLPGWPSDWKEQIWK